MATPSTSANRSPKRTPVAQARSSASLAPWNGSGSSVEHSALMTGKNSAFPAGTLQLPTAIPDALMTPVRNQTGPGSACPFAPLVQEPPSSKKGFRFAANESAHYHHLALPSPYVMPNGLASGGMIPAGKSCAATGNAASPTIVTNAAMRHRCRRWLFTNSSSLSELVLLSGRNQVSEQ